MSHHTKLDGNLKGDDKFRAWKYRISLVLKENELDSYINEEVPVLEGDEAKALHKNNLVKAKRIIVDSIKTSVFHKDTKRDVWFFNQAIWREEYK